LHGLRWWFLLDDEDEGERELFDFEAIITNWYGDSRILKQYFLLVEVNGNWLIFDAMRTLYEHGQ
jgi:hypothetical protein